MKRFVKTIALITVLCIILSLGTASLAQVAVKTPAPSAVPETSVTPDGKTLPLPTPVPLSTPTPEESTPVVQETDGTLCWDLTEYYINDAAFDADIQHINEDLLPAYKTLIDGVSNTATLKKALAARDETNLATHKTYYYAYFKTCLNGTDALAIKQKSIANGLVEQATVLDQTLDRKLLSMDDAFWQAIWADQGLNDYFRQLSVLLESEKYVCTAEQEALLAPAYRAKSDISDVYFKLSMNNMQWNTVENPEGDLIEANLLNYRQAMLHPNRDYRRAFFVAYENSLNKYRDVFAQNMNAYVSLSESISKIHGFDSLLAETVFNNEVDLETYDALITAARAHTDLLARENAMIKAAQGVDELYSYDLSIPLIELEQPKFTIGEAQTLIEKALAPLGEEYGSIIKKAFAEGWIDAAPSANKFTGGFSGGSEDMHPWLLVNFTGDFASVSTLAHELGHAIHQYMSCNKQKSLYNATITPFLSEVASITNEMLLNSYMISTATTEQEKAYYLSGELEMMRSTFFRQIQFADFEKQMHAIVTDGGAITADGLDAIYLDVLKTYSPGVETLKESSGHWALVPHFYYDYYVYCYGLDIAIACNVAEKIQDKDGKLLQNYLAFLSMGNSLPSTEQFQSLGVDIKKTDFMQPLFQRYTDDLDQLEGIINSGTPVAGGQQQQGTFTTPTPDATYPPVAIESVNKEKSSRK